MTAVLWLLGVAALAACFYAGYLFGRVTRSESENQLYMQAFADGELHALLNERAPSPN